MTNETKIIIGLILALGAFTFYLYDDTQDEIRRSAQFHATQCPPSADYGPPLMQAQRNQISMAASHTYFELLLEGIARKQGLPLERARKAFDAEVKGNKPPKWKWLAAWEEEPKDSETPPKEDGEEPTPKNGNDIFNDR